MCEKGAERFRQVCFRNSRFELSPCDTINRMIKEFQNIRILGMELIEFGLTLI